MEKALGYLRVSGKGQVDGDGFPRQREAIARYAKTAGIRTHSGESFGGEFTKFDAG